MFGKKPTRIVRSCAASSALSTGAISIKNRITAARRAKPPGAFLKKCIAQICRCLVITLDDYALLDAMIGEPQDALSAAGLRRD
jgi:hypothetical protein